MLVNFTLLGVFQQILAIHLGTFCMNYFFLNVLKLSFFN